MSENSSKDEEKQSTLEENGEDSKEEESEEIEEESEPKKDLFDEWLDEVEERYDRVEERFGDRRDAEIIKEKAIRPFFYFKDDKTDGDGENGDEPQPITDKQSSYLQDLADKSSKRFFKFVNNEEDIDSVGPPEEVIGKLTKEQASEIIDFLNQPKDYEDYKEDE